MLFMKVALLGSTGSIGKNTLAICKKFDLEVEVLVAGNNIEELKKQIAFFKPKIVVTASPNLDLNAPIILNGEEGILEALELSSSPVVVNALVGFLGLKPTLKALELGKKVALANKESLVVAGKFIDTSNLTPIDSEHFGLWYLLQTPREVKRLLLTASGGAFRDWEVEKIQNATLKDALNHPNWSMGEKITLDSATMVNKLFEILEAYWFFKKKEIDAVIEPTSQVHAAIEFKDGSTLLHLSLPDMKLPIAYALGVVDEVILEPLDLFKVQLEFKPIAVEKYPVWGLKEKLLEKPELGVVVNAANEAALELFKLAKINFFEIHQVILDSFKQFKKIRIDSVEDIFSIDNEVRNYVYSKYRK